MSVLNIAEGVETRAQLINQINEKVKQLNNDFRKNPNAINIDTIQGLITNLIEINESLESQTANKNRSCWSKSRKWIHYSLIAVGGLAAIAHLAGAVLQSLGERLPQCPEEGHVIGVNIGGTVGEFLSLIALGIFSYVDENEANKDKKLESAMQVKKFGEESFKRFLEALQEFQKNKEIENLKQCVQCLNDMPKEGLKGKLIDQSELIPLLIQRLPNEDPLKIQLNKIKKEKEEDDRFKDTEKMTFNDVMEEEVDAFRYSNPYKLNWDEIEEALDMRFEELTLDGNTYHKNGTVTEAEREEEEELEVVIDIRDEYEMEANTIVLEEEHKKGFLDYLAFWK